MPVTVGHGQIASRYGQRLEHAAKLDDSSAAAAVQRTHDAARP
jgi:hypothetical protein